MGRASPNEVVSDAVEHIAMAETTHRVTYPDTVAVTVGDAIGDAPPTEMAFDAVERVVSGDAEPTEVDSSTVTTDFPTDPSG